MDRADDRALGGSEHRHGRLVACDARIGRARLIGERRDGGVGAGRGSRSGERRAGLRPLRYGVRRHLVRYHDLAQGACVARRIGRLVGVVIGHDFLVGGGDARNLLRTDARDPKHPLLGDHVARPIGGVILLELRVARLQPGLERVDRHHRGFAFALLEQHRRIRRRHPERRVTGRRDGRQQVSLGQFAGENLAQLCVAQSLLR